jgi:Nucleoside phosphorylase
MDVAIVIALKEEFELFEAMIGPRRESIPDDHTGDVFYTFEKPSANPKTTYKCVACFAGRMGSVEMAILTQQIILKWNPKNLVMLGIAAGISENVRLGDLIIADSVDDYIESGRIEGGLNVEFAGQVYQCSAEFVRFLDNFPFSKKTFYDSWIKTCSERLQGIGSECQLKSAKDVGLASSAPILHIGPLASGPFVVASSDFRRRLLARNRKFLGIDMEAAGMAAAVRKYADQQRILVIRGISDFGDERKRETDKIGGGSFRYYAALNAIELLWNLLSAGMFQFSGTDRTYPERLEQEIGDEATKIHDVSLPTLAELADRTMWSGAVHNILKYIHSDMHTSVECRGGWGKSYAERYQTRTYPQGMPKAFAPQPDTPSGTAMVVEGLYCLKQIPDYLSHEDREMVDGCLAETSEYFLNRYDPVTGAVGVKTLLATGDTATAYNLRHSALALKAFHQLPSFYNQLGSCSEYVIRSSEKLNLETEHVLKIVAVLSGLDLISNTANLKHGLPDAHKLPYLIRKAEIALLKRWSASSRGWVDCANPTTTIFWYSLLVLKDLSKLCMISDPELVDCSNRTLQMLFECIRELPGNQLGMLYRIGGPPDLGMSCMLLEILARTRPTPQNQMTLRGLCHFVIAHTEMLNASEQDYIQDTYPWTLVSLFGGLSALSHKETGQANPVAL